MIQLDLCACCVVAVWPSPSARRAYHGYGSIALTRTPAREGKAASVRQGAPSRQELEEGAEVEIPGGQLMKMRAVTTVRGTRCCEYHAALEIERN